MAMDGGMQQPMNHGDSGAGMAMPKMTMMQMSFYGGKEVTLLFEGWATRTTAQYAFSLVAVFAIGVLQQLLGLALSKVSSSSSSGKHGKLLLLPLRALAFAAYATCSYALMLLVMSFNAGVFVVAILGLTAGFIAFHSHASSSSSSSSAAHSPAAKSSPCLV